MNGFVYYSEELNELHVAYFKFEKALYYRKSVRIKPFIYIYIGEL